MINDKRFVDIILLSSSYTSYMYNICSYSIIYIYRAVVLVSENNNEKKNITSRMKLSVTFCIWVMVGKYYFFFIYIHIGRAYYRHFTARDISAAASDQLFRERIFPCVVNRYIMLSLLLLFSLNSSKFFFHTHVCACTAETLITIICKIHAVAFIYKLE